MKGGMISDQLNNWSDEQKQERILSAKETPPAPFPIVTVRRRSPWLSHRAIQTLRKTGLPLCRWTWARAEVLPLDQSIGSSTRDALCSTEFTGASGALCERLPESSRNPKRDNEHQPRALEAARAFLERRHVAYERHACGDAHRLWRSRGFASKHARVGVAERDYRERESGGVA